MSNLLDKASILLSPTAYNNGSMLSVKPTDGDGDFTFVRGSAATRVNAQGLVENVQIISSELITNGNFSQIGLQLVINGDFAADTNWSKDANWTIANGKATSTGNGRMFQSIPFLEINIGVSVKVTFDILELTQGGVQVNCYGGISQTFTTLGTHTFFTTTTNGSNLYFNNGGAGSNFIGSIDNCSVKQVGQGWTVINGNITDKYNASMTAYQSGIRVSPFNKTGKFKVLFDLVITSGNMKFDAGGVNNQTYTTSGTKEIIIINPTKFEFNAFNLGWVGTLDNVSVKEVTDDTNIPRINYEGFSYQDALGSELVTNGDFATDSNWSLGTGWSIGEGKAVCIGDSNHTTLTQNESFVSGKTYKVTFDIVVDSGTFKIQLLGGGNDSGNTIASTQIQYTEYIVATSNWTSFGIRSNDGNGIGSITNISVKEYLGQEVVPDSGCGSWLLERQSTNLYLNSETLVTQSNATSASTYTVSFYGSGSITFSGTHIGSLVGNGADERVSVTFTATSGTLTSTIIGSVNKGQLEEQSFATSYIPTEGATNTRNQDIATNSGNATLINSTEGVLYAEMSFLDDNQFKFISLSNGSSTIRVSLFSNSSTTISVNVKNSSGNQFNTSFSIDSTINHKLALKYKENDFALWIDGQERLIDLSGTTFPTSTLSELSFDNGNGTAKFFGKAKCLAVYKEALTDAELQSLTTI